MATDDRILTGEVRAPAAGVAPTLGGWDEVLSSDFSPAVVNVEAFAGDDLDLMVDVATPAGLPVDLVAATEVLVEVRATEAGDVLLTKRRSTGDVRGTIDGRLRVLFNDADTTGLGGGFFVYRATPTFAGRTRTVQYGRLMLHPVS
jgi:hypothetical protein